MTTEESRESLDRAVEESRSRVLEAGIHADPAIHQFVDALIEAVSAKARAEERERTKQALNILNNYQLWPETRISQARAILACSSEEAGG